MIDEPEGRVPRRAGGDSDARSTLGALALVLLLLCALVLLPRVLHFGGAMGVGRDAPDFALPLVANGAELGQEGTLRLSTLRGRVVLIDFWATWCEPCRLQAPIVEQVARRWRERGVVVVGVNTDTPAEGDPRAFALSRGLTYPVVHDSAGAASRAYGIDELPTLLVVSRTGKIVGVRTGVTEGAELERLLQHAL